MKSLFVSIFTTVTLICSSSMAVDLSDRKIFHVSDFVGEFVPQLGDSFNALTGEFGTSNCVQTRGALLKNVRNEHVSSSLITTNSKISNRENTDLNTHLGYKSISHTASGDFHYSNFQSSDSSRVYAKARTYIYTTYDQINTPDIKTALLHNSDIKAQENPAYHYKNQALDVNAQELVVDDISLTDTAYSIYRINQENFKAQCGTHFLATLHYGMMLEADFEYKSSSYGQKRNFIAETTASGGGFSLNAFIGRHYDSNNESDKTTFNYKTYGTTSGNPVQTNIAGFQAMVQNFTRDRLCAAENNQCAATPLVYVYLPYKILAQTSALDISPENYQERLIKYYFQFHELKQYIEYVERTFSTNFNYLAKINKSIRRYKAHEDVDKYSRMPNFYAHDQQKIEKILVSEKQIINKKFDELVEIAGRMLGGDYAMNCHEQHNHGIIMKNNQSEHDPQSCKIFEIIAPDAEIKNESVKIDLDWERNYFDPVLHYAKLPIDSEFPVFRELIKHGGQHVEQVHYREKQIPGYNPAIEVDHLNNCNNLAPLFVNAYEQKVRDYFDDIIVKNHGGTNLRTTSVRKAVDTQISALREKISTTRQVFDVFCKSQI